MIVDLFAGPGGWDEGARLAGLTDVVGIEWEHTACRTAVAAGHRRIRADVATYPAERFAGADGLIASPPCTDWSQAGKRLERDGSSGDLVDQVPRWVAAVRPRWFACEQVPPALVAWEEFARSLRELGYSTWAGVLNAADYGVPQTRRRAFLLGKLDGPAHPPAPTHAKDPGADLFDDRRPWVSMAEALGWTGAVRRLRGAGLIDRAGPRRDHPVEEPAPTVLANGGSHGPGFVLAGDRDDRPPIMVNTGRDWKPGGSRADAQVIDAATQPAPTVDSRGRWHAHVGDVAADDEAEVERVLHASSASRPNDRTRPRPVDQPAPTVCFGHSRMYWEDRYVVRTGSNSMVTGRTGSKAGDGDVQAYERSIDEPAPTLDRKVGGAWKIVPADRWSNGEANDPDWPADRPATTVAGDPRIAQPGHKAEKTTPGAPGRMAGAIRVEAWEAGVLQSFPADYPWQGNKTAQFLQVGNAVPPIIAAAILETIAAR